MVEFEPGGYARRVVPAVSEYDRLSRLCSVSLAHPRFRSASTWPEIVVPIAWGRIGVRTVPAKKVSGLLYPFRPQ